MWRSTAGGGGSVDHGGAQGDLLRLYPLSTFDLRVFIIELLTHASTTQLQAIDRASVHRICSGQVVVDLATAVKELVENSIDAKATKVEVVLRDYGVASVQVSDDGTGVDKDSLKMLAQKHWTSKITEFKDLQSVRSFGFRGEALSSLCALGKVQVATRTCADTTATRVDFSPSGDIESSTAAARGVGTTVVVRDLFKPLPVRWREFKKNAKREYGKAVRLLQGYAIAAAGVRVSVAHQVRSRRNKVFSTEGSGDMRRGIVSVYGAKQAACLSRVEADFSDAALGLDETADARVSGWVSKAADRCGRSTGDRQHVFLNGRPVDTPRVARAVTDAYRAHGAQRDFPVFAIRLDMSPDLYDVNVTPNKRTVFFKQRARLLGALKQFFGRHFAPAANSFTVRTMDEFVVKKATAAAADDGEQRNAADDASSTARTVPPDPKPAQDSNPPMRAPKRPRKVVEPGPANRGDSSSSGSESESSSPEQDEEPARSEPARTKRPRTRAAPPPRIDMLESFGLGAPRRPRKRPARQPIQASEPKRIRPARRVRRVEHDTSDSSGGEPAQDSGSDGELDDASIDERDNQSAGSEKMESAESPHPSQEQVSRRTDAPPVDMAARAERVITFDMERVAQAAAKMASAVNDSARAASDRLDRAERGTGDAGRELGGEGRGGAMSSTAMTRVVQKRHFREMRIVGQFNLGFIITKLGDDLFIIDQHASDEKYNFERLQRSTRIHSQRLIAPLPVRLSPALRLTIVDNLDVFTANGFEFCGPEVDEAKGRHPAPTAATQPAKCRLFLERVPLSKNTTFGIDDVMQLCVLIDQAGGGGGSASKVSVGDPATVVGAAESKAAARGDSGRQYLRSLRIPKLRAMHAMRACRGSIMIGRSLAKLDMRRLVRNMATLEQPWNCPHGRPTMRHLFDMQPLRSLHARAVAVSREEQ